MRQIAQTKHVRIEAGVYKRLQALSQKTGMSAAEIATFCIDDCLKAYEAKKAIIPRVLLIMNVIEGGTKFEKTN
jgi:predicted DNA-binding protein